MGAVAAKAGPHRVVGAVRNRSEAPARDRHLVKHDRIGDRGKDHGVAGAVHGGCLWILTACTDEGLSSSCDRHLIELRIAGLIGDEDQVTRATIAASSASAASAAA